MRLSPTAKDLSIDMGAGARHTRKTHKARFRNQLHEGSASLVSVGKRSAPCTMRTLYTTGYLPQAAYAARVQGMPFISFITMRRMAVAAALPHLAGRCTTTINAIVLGDYTPEIWTRVEQLRTW